jgi:hypothetical protein
MADHKGKRTPKSRTRRFQGSQFKGKTIHNIELSTTASGCSIGIMFQDRTYLCFEVKTGVTILPDLSDWKKSNYRLLTRWRTIHS